MMASTISRSTTATMPGRFQSCLKKSRTQTDIKTTRSVHFDGYPVSSVSNTTGSMSSLNTNHSMARLEILAARPSEKLPNLPTTQQQQSEENRRNTSSHAAAGVGRANENLVQPNYVEQYQPLSRSANTSFCELMIQKYSDNNDGGPDDPTDDRRRKGKTIIKKYGFSNIKERDDDNPKYDSKALNGDIMRKYRVSGYDKTMRNYHPSQGESVLRKYSRLYTASPSSINKTTSKGDGSSSSRMYNNTQQDLAVKKREKDDGGVVVTPKRKVSQVRNKVSNDNNVVNKTEASNKKQIVNNKSSKTIRPIQVEKTESVQNNLQDRKTLVAEKSGGGRHKSVNRKQQKISTTEHGKTVLSRKVRGTTAMKANPSSKVKVQSRQAAQVSNDPDSVDPSHYPLKRNNAITWLENREEGVKNYFKTLRRREEELSYVPWSQEAAVTPRDIYVDDQSHFDQSLDLDESETVRLEHLLDRQAQLSSYSPSTPVDRRELSKTTPQSIYEKVESEIPRPQRNKSPKMAASSSKFHSNGHIASYNKFPMRKSANRYLLPEKVRANRVETPMAPSQVVSYETLHLGMSENDTRSKKQFTGSAPDKVLERQMSSEDDFNLMQWHNLIVAESQQRAYGVYYETGERATKPGDLMQVVKYFKDDVAGNEPPPPPPPPPPYNPPRSNPYSMDHVGDTDSTVANPTTPGKFEINDYYGSNFAPTRTGSGGAAGVVGTDTGIANGYRSIGEDNAINRGYQYKERSTFPTGGKYDAGETTTVQSSPTDPPPPPPSSPLPSQEDDFISEYRKLQRQFTPTSLSSPHSHSLPSPRSMPHKSPGAWNPYATQQQIRTKTLDDLRRQSVGTWLHRRGRCTRYHFQP